MKILTASQVYTICQFAGVNTDGMDFRWDDNGSGCDAVFIKVDDYYGLKAFHNEAVAKLSYHYNRIFSHFGYTPKAWGFSSVKIRGREFFYFFTEVCQEYHGDEENEGTSYYDSDNEYHSGDEYDSELSDLETYIYKLTGFRNADIHPGNYGYLNGQLVCIDVGHIKHEYINNDGHMVTTYPKWI